MWRYGAAFAAAAATLTLTANAASINRNVQIWGNGQYDPRPDHPEDLLDFSNFRPKLIQNFREQGSPNLDKISFGPSWTASIDERGKMWIWPKVKITGYKVPGDRKRDLQPLDHGKTFKDIAWTDSKGILFALDTSGDVYQWRFDQEEMPTCRKITTAERMTSISTGFDHVAFIGESGSVYTMGDDTFGQCGIADHNRKLSDPYLIMRYPNLAKVVKLEGKAVDVKCGKYHTVALMENG
jgi:alpha-tubulin suppressor-like RCC1 family protein